MATHTHFILRGLMDGIEAVEVVDATRKDFEEMEQKLKRLEKTFYYLGIVRIVQVIMEVIVFSAIGYILAHLTAKYW